MFYSLMNFQVWLIILLVYQPQSW